MVSRYPVARFFQSILLPILLTTIGTSSFAQDFEKGVIGTDQGVPLPGKIRLKIDRTHFNETIGADFFGRVGEQLQISTVRPWLNRDLLRFADKSSQLFKSNGKGYESWGNSLSRIIIVDYAANISPIQAAQQIASVLGVEYAEPVWERRLAYTPNDPDVTNARQWYLPIIKAFDAWNFKRADGSVVIGITDTGIDPDHPDLAGQLWTNPGEDGEKRNNGIDDDGNGLVDDWWGYDFGGVNGSAPDNDPGPSGDEHGTHVAGIAGAIGNNDIGGAGVAYGVRLMSIKIGIDGDDPPLPGGFDGILYAAAMGADVINCSWGGPGNSIAEQEVITSVTNNLGVLVVSAAGNNSIDQRFYPASYNGVLSIAATKSDDAKATVSNYNYRVDLSAPGQQIWSTILNGQYGYLNGTSMATPMVAAGAALLLQIDPTLTPLQVAEVLRATADPFSPIVIGSYENKLGTGRMNLHRAVTQTKTIRSARLTSYQIEEPGGNDLIDPGENVTIRSTVTNILANADNVSLTMEVVSPANISLVQNSHSFGAMEEKQSSVTPGGKFVLQIPNDVLPDTRIVIKTTVTTADRSNVEYIELTVFPTWGTTALNNIAISFNSVGNVGHATSREEGIGFYFGDEGSLIWHGGLMIGTSATKLPDVVRVGSSDKGTGRGFQLKEPYRLTRDDANSTETGKAKFTDVNSLLGVEVSLTTKEYDNENYVLVFYEVKNTSNLPLENLFCGLYLDWDLTPEGTNDHASWDGTRKMGFVRHTIPSVTTLTTGIALLSNQGPNYYAANSQGDDSYILTDFTDARKWNMLSRGVSKENNPTVGTVDASMTIGGGPVTIAPGESETFVFGIMAANDFTTLQETADRAKEQYDFLASAPPVAGTSSGIELSLFPTLFSEETTILLNLEKPEEIQVDLFNLSGEKVSTLYSGRMKVGENRVQLNGVDLPSGTYIVRVVSGTGVVERKGILVR